MENPVTHESDKCRHLAAAMRQDATRATMNGLADKLVRGAEELEQLAMQLLVGYFDAKPRFH